MNWIYKTVALALLTLWLPVTSHCRLESIPGLEFLICCSHQEPAPHQDSDCEGDSCQSLESGAYKIQDNHDLVPLPDFNVASFLPPKPVEIGACVCGTILTAAPPELPGSWQFSFRTALPVRAPSLAS